MLEKKAPCTYNCVHQTMIVDTSFFSSAPTQEMAELCSSDRFVASVGVELVELVRRMHSCHLVHGALSPDTLFLNHRYRLTYTKHYSS